MLKHLIVFAIAVTASAFASAQQCNIPVVKGETNVCLNSMYGYTVTNIASGTMPPNRYKWTIQGPAAGYSFVGNSPIGEFQNILWRVAGTYTVSVYLQSCGISFQQTFLVNVSSSSTPPPPPGEILGSASGCLNDTVTYSVTQQPGISYFWSVYNANGLADTDIPVNSNGNQAAITWSKEGKFTVAVSASNGSCGSMHVSTLSVGVGLPTQPSVPGGNPSACINTQNDYYISNLFPGATLVASVTGAGNSVTTNGNIITANWGSTMGSYTVSTYASNACGNSSTNSFNVWLSPPPNKPVISGPDYACTGMPVTLSVTGSSGSQQWEVVPSTFTRSGSTFTFTQPGTYNLRLRTSQNCYSPYSDTKTIVVSTAVPQPVILGASAMCALSHRPFSVGNPVSGATYNWRASSNQILINGSFGLTPVTGPEITVSGNTAGLYTLYVNAPQPPGCPATTEVSHTLNIQTPLANENTSEIIGSTSVCQDIYPYSIFLSEEPAAKPNARALWMLSGGGVLIPDLTNSLSARVGWQTPGTYTLTAYLTNSCGIDQTKTLLVNVSEGLPPYPMFPINGPPAALLYTTVPYFTAPHPDLTFKWFTTGEIVSEAGENVSINWITESSSHQQTIILNTNNGICDSRPTISNIDVYAVPQSQARMAHGETPALQHAERGESSVNIVGVHPNPADKNLTITLPEDVSEPSAITMYDAFGTVSIKDQVEAGKLSHTISTQDLPSGLYILHLEIRNRAVIKKLIVIDHK